MRDELVLRLLDENRAELDRVDGKANLAMAVVLAITAGIGLALVEPSSVWRTTGGLALVIAVVAFVLASLSLALIGMAVFPRSGTPEPGQARYFAEQASFESGEQLLAAIDGDSASADRHGHQIVALAKLLDRKYELLRVAFTAMGASLIMCVVAGFLTGL